MLNVLANKYLMRRRNQGNETFRFEEFTWIFYTDGKPIRKLVGKEKNIVVINREDQDNGLLNTYENRIFKISDNLES